MNERIKILALVILAAALAALIACSSAPKRPPEVFTGRKAALGQIELANRSAAKGEFANAHILLDEAWRLASAADDPDTRVRVLLSRGNAFYNGGEADKADRAWQEALTEAAEAKETALAGAARVFLARGTLAEGWRGAPLEPEERATRANEAIRVARSEMGSLKDNALYEAFAWKVIGMAEKELGNAGAAEKALREAVAIHEKGRYLEDTAYDWYLIASVRSKAGNLSGARMALDTAISFDRRAENSNGLGMDWVAVGIVEEKAGNREKAVAAYRRAVGIFRSAYQGASAADAERHLAALGEEVNP